MTDQQTWLRRIDIGLGLALVATLAYTLTRMPWAGELVWGIVAAAGTTVVFAVPVAVVFGRRDHRMLLETPVLVPMVLLLPAATAVLAACAGIGIGTAWRTVREGRHDARPTTARTIATFTPSVAVLSAIASGLEPSGGGWLVAAGALSLAHLMVVLPVPILRARVNAPARTGADPRDPWRQLGPSLAVAPAAAITAGAIALLIDSHGPVGLSAYAAVGLLLAGGQRLTAAQQDRRRLDALYALALDTTEATSGDAAYEAAAVAARHVLVGAEIALRARPGGPDDASFELGPGRWLVASRHTDGFTPDDIDLFAAVGRLATTSAHRALLHHELSRQERVKTALLAAAGHDLQTPLAVQLGLAETVLTYGDEMDDEQRADILGRIARNARRMSRTISGLVDLEQLELSDRGVAASGCDAAEVISRWAAETELPNGRFLELDVEEPGHTPVALSATYLERVVENLAANASRYSPREVPITVRVARRDGEVLVAVEDRGSGVPESDRERIFQALDQGTDEVHGSVGLGLFIVSRLVEHGGGTIEVRDRDGGGASFRVLLPLVGAAAGRASLRSRARSRGHS